LDRSWSETELAYFAGIVDGEGCFAMHRHTEDRFGAQLQIGNTDLLLMQWIQRHFDGSLNLEKRRNAKHQDVWRWTASASDLDRILQGLIPYLITKKRQAELFVAYRATMNQRATSGRRSRGISHSTSRKSAEVKAERMKIRAELDALKRPHLHAVSA